MSPPGISSEVRRRVLARAAGRCGYCRSPQSLIYGRLHIDHIRPQARGGTDDEENLWAACSMCNGAKGSKTHATDPRTARRVRLFHPGRQQWSRHFQWSEDGTEIRGRTASGRATVEALRLNDALAVEVRRAWVSAGWHPPVE